MDREELLALCRDAFVPQNQWNNRNSARAQQQLGECYALLMAGCDFDTTWTERDAFYVQVYYQGFDWFEGNGDPHEPRDALLSHQRYCLPTRDRLAKRAGKDWY